MMKTCSRCKQTKPLEEFYKNKSGKPEYCYYCILCSRTVALCYARKHVEQLKQRRNQLKEEVLGHYSKGKPICARCGFNDIRALSIDHINGNGNKHRKTIGVGAGRNFYLWLKRNNYPKDFQVLCMNCQFISVVS